MPTQFNSMLIKEKIPIKNLILELDENDDILSSIAQGLRENKIKEAKLVDINGFVIKGIVNCMEGAKYKRIDIKDIEIMRASGNFKMGGEDMWGNLNVFTAGRKPISGTLLKGSAKQGLKITLNFIEK